MARLSLFLDIGGRVVKEATGDPFFTVGGVLLNTSAEESVRRLLAQGAAKWKHADASTLDLAIRVLGGEVSACAVIVVEKTQPWWDEFWNEGTKQHRELTVRTNTATGFARPGTVLRFWAFGACAAVLLGAYLRRYGTPQLLDESGMSMLRLKVICDTDIQGDENQDVFRSTWDAWAGRTRLSTELGVQPRIDLVEFRQDENEPILSLADILAGFGYVRRSGLPSALVPVGLKACEIEQFGANLDRLDTAEQRSVNFKEAFPNLAT